VGLGFHFMIGEQQRPRGTDGLVLLLKLRRHAAASGGHSYRVRAAVSAFSGTGLECLKGDARPPPDAVRLSVI
jgi:hypothetical protein